MRSIEGWSRPAVSTAVQNASHSAANRSPSTLSFLPLPDGLRAGVLRTSRCLSRRPCHRRQVWSGLRLRGGWPDATLFKNNTEKRPWPVQATLSRPGPPHPSLPSGGDPSAPVPQDARRSMSNILGCAPGNPNHCGVEKIAARLAPFAGFLQAPLVGRDHRTDHRTDNLHAAPANCPATGIYSFDTRIDRRWSIPVAPSPQRRQHRRCPFGYQPSLRRQLFLLV
jgi:hypothetical protein